MTRVWIDGVSVGGAGDGWSVTVEPGRHVVRAAVDGHPPVEESVLVAQGEKNRTVLLRMTPKKPAQPVARGAERAGDRADDADGRGPAVDEELLGRSAPPHLDGGE